MMPYSISYLSTRLVQCLFIGLTALASGCDQAQEASLSFPEPGHVPASEQRSGDPDKGYDALVNEQYITCGIPYEAYQKMAQPVPSSHRLPERTGRNAELPYNLTAGTSADGIELVSSNCLTCHAGFFNNQLVVGLGNESRDFTQDPALFAEGVGRYVSGEAATQHWRKWADRWAAIAPYMIMDTIGVNPANNLTLALIAHRDPETLAWSPEPLLEPPPEHPLPVSVPPWWRMGKKHAMFYLGSGRGDHARIMMTASILCTDSVAEARRIDTLFTDIRAYIAALEPPAYPFPINQGLATQGQQVFEQHCSRCHGTYGEQEDYPNLVIALDTIGTDPLLAQSARQQEKRFIRWFERSFFGETARIAPVLGYYAPPLDGVWATAPYLHNGSVPTLTTLLDSPRRPTYWTRSFDSQDYDPDNLGWRYTELDHGKAEARNPKERKRIYDTTLPGYSNQGHTFGDDLSEQARAAVLEYIKTL